MSFVTIVCDFNLGTRAQSIYKCNSADNTVESIGDVYFNDLALSLLNAFISNDANSIHLYGPVEVLTGLAQEIYKTNDSVYNNTNLKVEIN